MTQPLDSSDAVILVGENGIGGGPTIVRWYPDVWSAERNHVMMTATSTGITTHTRYLNEIPAAWLESARSVYSILQVDAYADLQRMATHKNSVASNGPLVAVGHA